MAKNNRAYKSAKRNKELDRLKKREEKRLKRLRGETPAPETGEEAPAEGVTQNPGSGESQ
ncbi:MAG: hypothetical protein ABSF88_11020 [Candidatus Aminicenantales bacterium]